jgi:hypothetical protein
MNSRKETLKKKKQQDGRKYYVSFDTNTQC